MSIKVFKVLIYVVISTTMMMFGSKCNGVQDFKRTADEITIKTKCANIASDIDQDTDEKLTQQKADSAHDLEKTTKEIPTVKALELGEVTLTEDQVKEKTEILEDRLEKAMLKLKSQPGCLRLSGRIAVVGDIHGDYGALCSIVEDLQSKLDLKKIDKVLFLGDFLDRFKTRSTDTLIKLIDFFIKNENVFILCGNHEFVMSYFVSDADEEPTFKAIRSKHPNDDPIDNFKENLPHAAIINEDTLAVHGGIPWFKPEHSSRMNKNVDVNKCLEDFFTSSADKKGSEAKEAVFCATWSDFLPVPDFKICPNKSRKCYKSCLFGLDAVKEFFGGAAKDKTGFRLKYLIRGHDHYSGAFAQTIDKGLSITTVISSPALLAKCDFEPCGAVALVEEGSDPKILFNVR